MHFNKKNGKTTSFTLSSNSKIVQRKPPLAHHMCTTHVKPLNTNHLHICVLSISEPVDL